MKLISCYVEGYGKIKKTEYTFSEGVNLFCLVNGEGKTTLASFIKAMFYGLKSYRKGSTEFCDREHFYPFDGGLFGGTLTFEWEGKEYKIERFFGDKSDTSDTVKVYEKGVESNAFGEDIGKAVFGVDKESFERTAFLSGEDIEIKSTSGIHAQLNRFLQGGEEDADLDGALSALDKAAKAYKKSKGGNDRVSAETKRVARLNEDIENALTVKGALEEKYRRMTALDEEIKGLTKEIVQAQEENEKRAHFEHYDSLQEGISKTKADLQAIAARYPVGLPTEEEAIAANGFAEKEKQAKAKGEGGSFSSADEGKLRLLEGKFSKGVPTEGELLTVEKEIGFLSDNEAEKRQLEGKTATARQRELAQKFAHATPSGEKISATAAQVAEYTRLQRSLEDTPIRLQTATRSAKRYAIAAAFFALLLVAGGAVCLFQTLIGGILLAVGGLGLLADGFLYLNKKSAALPTENPECKRLEGELRRLEDSIKAALMPYGYYSDSGLAADFATFKADLAAYDEWTQEEQTRGAGIDRALKKCKECDEKLTAFFRVYDLSGDTYIQRLTDLRVQISDYRDLSARKLAAQKGKAQLEEEIRSLREKIEGYKRKYGLTEEALGGVIEDIRLQKRLTAALLEGEKRALAYCEEKGLDTRVTTEKKDLGQLQALLTQRQEEKSKLTREIDADETQAEQLEGYEAEKREAESLLKEYKRKHKLLTATKELLEEAEKRLLDKYVSPVKKEFVFYANIIEKALGERVTVTKDFELRFERNGVLRSEKHLSAGQRSVCALCFRLALVKNMYRDRLPFLVLDDPFTSLDEEHLSRVKEVLKALSNDTQMLYFTCHESRKM